MKTCVLFITLYLWVITTSNGNIKNGYGFDIQGARESLRNIKLLLEAERNLPFLQKVSMKNKIDDLIHFITYYELTEKLLDQFRSISPDLYYEIDSLRDKKGRNVNIYIKFVPENEMLPGVAGTTNIAQDINDPDAYHSEYGIHTVSVRIKVDKKSLQLLAHELGHVQYQVPNLASYIGYHKQYYLTNSYKAKSMGHNDNDPSGRQARDFTNRFQKTYLEVLRAGKTKIDSHIALLQVIKTQIQ